VSKASSRERFLDEVLRFVRSAANLSGVLRITLVGSVHEVALAERKAGGNDRPPCGG
jgi:hypothetical protein